MKMNGINGYGFQFNAKINKSVEEIENLSEMYAICS